MIKIKLLYQTCITQQTETGVNLHRKLFRKSIRSLNRYMHLLEKEQIALASTLAYQDLVRPNVEDNWQSKAVSS